MRFRQAPRAEVIEHRQAEGGRLVRPPAGARNLVVVVLDSLRHDAWVAADVPNLDTLGTVERRHSYATWTAPSHYNLLTGLLPHPSPRHVYAADLYRDEYARYAERLGVPDVDFADLLPGLWLPSHLKNRLGYRTHALVSMPVLNGFTGINRSFDTYELMDSHHDFTGMIDRMRIDPDQPSFWLLNVGETHYPYAIPGEDTSRWPRLSGVHGVVKRLDGDAPEEVDWFSPAEMEELRQRQIAALEFCDVQIGRLFDLLPDDSWVVVTSDHGELFGEDGYFGHGPINHEKVMEVPFVEGRVP